MNLDERSKHALVFGAAAVLAVVAIFAATHHTALHSSAAAELPANPEPVAPAIAPAPDTPVVFADSPFGQPAAAVKSPALPPPAAAQPFANPEPRQTSPAAAPRPYNQRGYYYRPHRSRVVVRRRPFRRSAEIVAGSAAGGAAIGAIAGGGKGAGIGAIAGGAGGYVYDRLTHKQRVVRQY